LPWHLRRPRAPRPPQPAVPTGALGRADSRLVGLDASFSGMTPWYSSMNPPGNWFVSRFRQRCQQCRQGRIFRSFITTNDSCPVCGLVFEREPGYFIGAMYVSYALSIVVLGTLLLVGHLLWPDVDLGLMVLLAGAVYLPVVPVAFRYSRV